MRPAAASSPGPIAPARAMSALARSRAGRVWHPLLWATARQQQRSAHAQRAVSPLLRDLPPEDPAWSGRSRWLLFSDLHVSEDTLGTCLEVLRHVRHTADQQDAGVVFLGAARRLDRRPGAAAPAPGALQALPARPPACPPARPPACTAGR